GGLLGSGLLLFLLRLVADEFEDSHLGGVAAAGAELDDAGVSARTVAEARSEGVEELGHDRVVFDQAASLPARVNGVVLAEGDQPLDLGAQLLRFGKRGDDAL